MDEISQDDIEFLDAFLSDELTEEGMQELDNRLKNPSFKKYYTKRLNQKFAKTPFHQFLAYLPMIVLIGLAIIGIYLIFIKM